MFGFSDTWQLIINTGTTIVTFLTVFLIQNTQNRDGAAIQANLDELVRVSSGANRYIGIEILTEEELEQLRERGRLRANSGGYRPFAGNGEPRSRTRSSRYPDGRLRSQVPRRLHCLGPLLQIDPTVQRFVCAHR